MQSTSSAQTLERGQVSAFGGIVFLELLHLLSGRVHRVAHAFAHGAKHREVRGIGQMLFDERDGDIEGRHRREGQGTQRPPASRGPAFACARSSWRRTMPRRPSRLVPRAPRAWLCVSGVPRARRCACRAG